MGAQKDHLGLERFKEVVAGGQVIVLGLRREYNEVVVTEGGIIQGGWAGRALVIQSLTEKRPELADG